VAEVRDRPWAVGADGLVVTVRLTPRGGSDLIEGAESRADGRCVLKARVRAAATEGGANDALTRLLAHAAGVAPSAARLIGGASSRIKRVHVAGDPAAIAFALTRIVEAAR
jgi:uncharacterized protein